jgi:hypothetical protein
MKNINDLQAMINESIRYWEVRRLAYNAVLALVVVGSFLYDRQWVMAMGRQWLLAHALAAVIANVLYCSAYAADLFLQLSSLRTVWLRCRWLLWLLGTAFASGIYLLHG